MVDSIKKQMTPKKFKEMELNKSKGILDDHAVRKFIGTKEGTITKTPVNPNDIVNKTYADAFTELDPVFVAWDKDHADLSNVTANQHHAQSHSLASHSTKAHTELTGVTADQHHAQAHAHTHASTTGQTADDHHNESHSLASHSTKAHTELTGVTASQHHTKAVSGDIDHDATVNTHNLTTDISHDSIADVSANDHHNQIHASTHEVGGNDLVSHDALTDFAANEHFTEASISHTNILDIGTNTHAQIDTHIAADSPATKSFFIPVVSMYDTSAMRWTTKMNVGDYGCSVELVGNDWAYMTFRVPYDFSRIRNAVIVVIPSLNCLSANWDTFSDYAAAGEPYLTHSESNVGSTYNISANRIFEIDVSGILDSLAADDYVGIRILNSQTEFPLAPFKILGIYFRYT